MTRKPEQPGTPYDFSEPVASDDIFENVESSDGDDWDDLPPLPGNGSRAKRPITSPPPLPGKNKRAEKAANPGPKPVRRGTQQSAPSWKLAAVTGIGTLVVVSALTYTLLVNVMGNRQEGNSQTASSEKEEVEVGSHTDSVTDTSVVVQTESGQQGSEDRLLSPDSEMQSGSEVAAPAETTEDPSEQLAATIPPDSVPYVESPSPASGTEEPVEPRKAGETDNPADETTFRSADGIPNDAGRLIASALSLVKADQRNEAVPHLKRASHIAPSDPRPDFYLGFLYLGSGAPAPKEARERITSAEMHFNKAFNRTTDPSPERAATANNLAIVELKLRKFGAARNYFGIAIKNAPRSQTVNHNVGRFLSLIKAFDVKADEAKKIQALSVPASDFQPNTGWIYLPLDLTQETQEQCLTFIPRHTFEDISCSSCNGCAQLVCIPCRGTGKVGVLSTAGEKRDIGFGMTASSTSMGTTNVVCRNCGGSGRLDCKACSDGRDSSLRK